MDGRGILVEPGNKLYISHFKNDKFHGQFYELRNDGTSVEGQLFENQLHGKVTTMRFDDTREIREYKHGQQTNIY